MANISLQKQIYGIVLSIASMSLIKIHNTTLLQLTFEGRIKVAYLPFQDILGKNTNVFVDRLQKRVLIVCMVPFQVFSILR
jgi:hypothetical protein